jgi:hypothetical protein
MEREGDIEHLLQYRDLTHDCPGFHGTRTGGDVALNVGLSDAGEIPVSEGIHEDLEGCLIPLQRR